MAHGSVPPDLKNKYGSVVNYTRNCPLAPAIMLSGELKEKKVDRTIPVSESPQSQKPELTRPLYLWLRVGSPTGTRVLIRSGFCL